MPVHWPETKLHEWLVGKAAPGAVIGFDPWLHTVEQVETLRTGLQGTGILLAACSNGIDAIWTDRPAPPNAPAWAHPPHLCGDTAEAKTRRLGAAIAAQAAQTAVITLPDSLCWLLNLRGSDVPRTPIVHCFGLLSDHGALTLFGDEMKFTDLTLPDTVTLAPWKAFPRYLKDLSGTVLIEPTSLPQAALDVLSAGSAKILRGLDPCSLPKACKTATELDGCRAAHLRDGAAVVRFLAWFDRADTSRLSEIDIVTRLETYRAATNLLHDISFDFASGASPLSFPSSKFASSSFLRISENTRLFVTFAIAHSNGRSFFCRYAWNPSAPMPIDLSRVAENLARDTASGALSMKNCSTLSSISAMSRRNISFLLHAS